MKVTVAQTCVCADSPAAAQAATDLPVTSGNTVLFTSSKNYCWVLFLEWKAPQCGFKQTLRVCGPGTRCGPELDLTQCGPGPGLGPVRSSSAAGPSSDEGKVYEWTADDPRVTDVFNYFLCNKPKVLLFLNVSIKAVSIWGASLSALLVWFDLFLFSIFCPGPVWDLDPSLSLFLKMVQTQRCLITL